MSDTPRTDAILSGPFGEEWSGLPGFTRQLERELTAAKAKVAALEKELADNQSANAGLRERVKTLESKVCQLKSDRAISSTYSSDAAQQPGEQTNG